MTMQAEAHVQPPAEMPSPEVMRGVIPYLNFDGRVGEAIDFYARAFGATDLGRMPWEEKPGQYMHAQIVINGGAFMMTDCRMEGEVATPGMQGGHMQLVVDDGRAWWQRAVDAGCRVVMPYERQFWGDDWGLLVDPFGVHWGILETGEAATATH